MIDLKESREEIDEIDYKIALLFEKRMKIAKDVAEYKIATGKKVYDPAREKEKLDKMEQSASSNFNQHGLRELFAQIMSISRKLQYGLLNQKKEIEEFKEKDMDYFGSQTKIVFFGEKGSHTQQAMEEYFGLEVMSYSKDTFKKVMQDLEMGKADYGILPIENTSTGSISDILDLLNEYNNYIVGEHILQINQSLLGLPHAKIEDLETIFSHPQGLMQSAKFLEKYPHIKTVEVPSTSAAAKKVKQENNIKYGAIAGKKAAEYYELDILKNSVNDNENNSTRFIIITNKKQFFKGADKISICFELPHKIGTLYNMLSFIIYNNLNMTQIESRPIPGKRFEYRFFVNFDGSLKESGVINAILAMKAEASHFKILGNYKSK